MFITLDFHKRSTNSSVLYIIRAWLSRIDHISQCHIHTHCIHIHINSFTTFLFCTECIHIRELLVVRVHFGVQSVFFRFWYRKSRLTPNILGKGRPISQFLGVVGEQLLRGTRNTLINRITKVVAGCLGLNRVLFAKFKRIERNILWWTWSKFEKLFYSFRNICRQLQFIFAV